MFGKLRRQTHQQDHTDHAQTTSAMRATAPAGQAIIAPAAPAAAFAPIGPAPLGPFAMQTQHTITARTRTTKDVIALVLAQRPAWTNRLPDVTPAEVAALRAQIALPADAPTPHPSAPSPITQPSTVPSMTKGGSSWAFIDHR